MSRDIKQQVPPPSTKTYFGISGPGNGITGETLVYILSVTGDNGSTKNVPDMNKIEAWLKGSTQTTQCVVSHPKDGQYNLTCSVNSKGHYKLDVKFGGKNLFSSELETEITEVGATSQSLKFELDGDGLHNGRIGEENNFNIYVTCAGTPCDIEISSLQAQCVGTRTYPLKVTRRSEGKYISSFKVGEPGNYNIVVKYHNNDKWQDVIQQPVVFSDETFGGYIVKKPDERVRVNNTCFFDIQSVDVMGEKVLSGGDIWQTMASGPERVDDITVLDQRDGTYRCELKFTTRGTYSLQVVLRGEVEATGSPLKFVVF